MCAVASGRQMPTVAFGRGVWWPADGDPLEWGGQDRKLCHTPPHAKGAHRPTNLLVPLVAVAAPPIGHTGTLDDTKPSLWQQSTQLSSDGWQGCPGVKTPGLPDRRPGLAVIGDKIDSVISCTSIKALIRRRLTLRTCTLTPGVKDPL